MLGIRRSRVLLGISAVIAASFVMAACQEEEPTATSAPPTATSAAAATATTSAAATSPAATATSAATVIAPASTATTAASTATVSAATATTGVSTPTAPAATATTPAATSTPVAGASLSVALKEQNFSTQSGIATLTARGSQTEVVLKATTGISKANHIHSGSCAQLGGVVRPLTDMANGASTTMVNASLNSLLTGGFAINLHNTNNASVYTACADLPAQSELLVIALREQNSSGQSGQATLIARGATTDVVLMATAGTSRANHIHSGTCAILGGVVYPLANMAADGSSVSTVNATLDSLRTGSFAINLHNTATASIYTSCGDIPRP